MPITKSFWILIIDTVDVQITKWLHLSFLFSSWLGRGRGRGRGGLRVTTWLIHYKKNQRNTDSHPAVLLNSFKFCAPVVFVWFWLFFSCLRRRGRRYKEDQILHFFPKHSFLFFYYHKMNLLYSFIISKILVYIFNSFFFWHTLEIQ